MKACYVSMVLSLAALSGPLQAQEKPAQPGPDKVRLQAVEAQKELARQFTDFQKNLQILKNRLERSSNEQDKRRADQLQLVLDKVDSDDIRNKFVKLQKLLGQKDFDLDEYGEAAKQTDELAKDLAKLVDMFERGDNQLALDIKEAKDLREALDRLIKEQEIVKQLTQDEQTRKKELADLQNNVKKAAEIARTIADPNSEKKSPKTPPQGAEAKDPKSEAKEGKGDNKSEARDPGKKNQAAEAKESGAKDPKDPKKAQEERPAEAKAKNSEKLLPETKLDLPKSGEKKDQGKGENKDANAKDAKGPKDGQAQAKEAQGNESKQATPKEAGNKDGKPQSPKEAGEAKNNEKGSEKEQPKTGDNKAAPKAKGTENKDNKEANAKTGKGPMDNQSQAKEAKGGEDKQATPKEAGKDGKQPEAKEAGEAKNNDKGNEKEQPKNADAKSKEKGPEAKDANAKESKGDPDSKADTKDAGKDSKQAEAKSGDTKPGQKSNAKSEPKEGGDAPPPSAKGDNSPMPPPEAGEEKDLPGGPKKVQDIDYAIKKMKEAKDNIEKEDNKKAADNQAAAIDALKKAKAELEKRLKLMRDEEIERLLANLKVRCERMLALQTEVLTGPRGTEVTWRAIQSNADKKPNGDNVQASLAQGEKEKEIIIEAGKAIEVLENEGTAVAFHQAFVAVREDMRQVHRRLSPEAGRQIDVGVLTQDMERDIIAQLKEMIEVLDKKKEEMDKDKKDKKKKQPSPPSPDDKGPPPDQKLLDTIQELKMIRSMQLRLNKRTEDIARSLPKGEEQQQPADPELRRIYEELRDRQERIADITNKIQKGDNK